MTMMSVVGECFFWYRLIQVVLDKIHRAIKRLCVCVCVLMEGVVKVYIVPEHFEMKSLQSCIAAEVS